MTKLSVAIIARNRAKEIEACLKSVKGADEIVVLDTGSTDNTPQVAIENGAIVYYARWEDDFAAARNKCLEYVHNPWVLVIDTDETLESGIGSIYTAIDRHFSSKVIAVRLNQPDGTYFFRESLFRKDAAHYQRAIHEELSRRADVVADEVVIQHRPSKDHRENPERNIAILRRILEKNPLSFMDAYYMGEELMCVDRHDAAIYWLSLFVELTAKTPHLTSEAHYLLAECFLKLRRVGVAIEHLVKAVNANPEMKAAYEQLYRLTKNEAWKDKAISAKNTNLVKIR